MFVGREKELETLNRMGTPRDFRMVVIYGRRRVGKTALIQEFCKNRRTLSFTATETTNTVNLRNFSNAVHQFFLEPSSFGTFESWGAAFEYIARRLEADPDHPTTIVFDELPYAATACPSLPSELQIVIDHQFLKTNATMILCGSNEGFMESRVLGHKAPLYGRRNAQIHLQPFNIFDARKLMPEDASPEDVVNYYATLGGTPFYLRQLEPDKTFDENIRNLCFRPDGLLYEEPAMLLRQELREPASYLSVLSAIASGRTTQKLISDATGISSPSQYLQTLESLGIVERHIPFGEKPYLSKRGLWKIKDPFFDYWFRFVGPNVPLIEDGRVDYMENTYTTGPMFSTYVGQRFEDVCVQWLFQREMLPFPPMRVGKWWGADPKLKEQTDIDVVMDNTQGKQLLLGECKWRNHIDETEAIRTLKDRRRLIQGDYTDCWYYLFTKKTASTGTQRKAKSDGTVRLVDAAAMLNGK